jgi:M6 family metalloprotease-like protein
MRCELRKVALGTFVGLLLALSPVPLHFTRAQAAVPGDFLKPYAGVKPVSGTRPVLVILLRARDRPNSVSEATIRSRIFGAAPGVTSYFDEISYGRFGIREAFVTPWLVAQDNPATQGVDESLSSFVHQGGETPEKRKPEWLIKAVDTQTNFDFSRFDVNKDGRVTSEELLIFWVYSGASGVGGVSRPADPSLIKVNGLSLGVEIHELSRVGETENWRTIAHEMLHQIHRLRDLYVDNSLNYAGVGPYSIMCAGSGAVHLDPWAKMKLGWLTPQVITQDGWYFLDDVERYPSALIVHNPGRGAKDYFVLENRWPGTSHEQSLAHGGLVVWRIEEKHDDANSDWGRMTIDRIWAQGEPSKASLVAGACPTKDIPVFKGNQQGSSYALTPSSSPGRLAWRDGTSSEIGLWFYSKAGARMRVYIDVPPLQAGRFRESISVSVGSSHDLASLQPLHLALLAEGRSQDNVIDVGIAGDGHAYAWYRDGTVSAGSPTDLGNYRKPEPFTLPAGRSPNDLVGIAIASDDHVYAWYGDRTVSAGSSRNLSSYRPPQPYTLPPGKTPNDIVGIAIAKDDHVYVWYRDSTVSAGSSRDLGQYRQPYRYSPQSGWYPSTIVAMAIDRNDRVHAWHSDPQLGDVDLAGPVLVGAFLEQPAVQPGMSTRFIVRAHRSDGTPLAGRVSLFAEAGLFQASSAERMEGRADAAGYFSTEWRAPSVSGFTRDETYITAVVRNERGHSGRVRVKVPILRQPIR